jgi:hypothetical protein
MTKMDAPVERRPHPTYDRLTFRRVMRWFGLAMLSFLIAWIAHEVGVGKWVLWLGCTGFLAAVAVLVWTPVNSCRCPTCDERLFRPENSNEFPCERCRITWVTRWYGSNMVE